MVFFKSKQKVQFDELGQNTQHQHAIINVASGSGIRSNTSAAAVETLLTHVRKGELENIESMINCGTVRIDEYDSNGVSISELIRN